MLHKRNTSAVTLAILLALTAVPKPLTASQVNNLLVAQSSSGAEMIPAPTDVPSDTKVGIDGSSSMKTINQDLKERFEQKFPGTSVNIGYDGSETAIAAVEEGKLDLAAIGRRLTQAEKDKGLEEVVVTRHKIAIITGPENPFDGSLTIDQFAKMFRGEIKNWSEVDGTAGVIRFVDRPATSDTRQAFPNYPVFQNAPLQTGANAVTLSEDTTEAVIKELGKDGISYAIVDQVVGNPNVKILKMHETLPDDPRYPFSQAMVYVYKGPNANPAAAAFLGYALNNQQPAPEPTTALVPEPSPQAEVAPSGGIPGWLWWLIPLALLALLPFLLKGRGRGSEIESTRGVSPIAPVPTPMPPVITPPEMPASRLILTPRNCRDAYAYWEVPYERTQELRRQGGRKLTLRLYDVTDRLTPLSMPATFQAFDCDERDPDLHVPISVDDHDYVAELGYMTDDSRWFPIAKSDPVHVPACEPVDEGLRMGSTAVAGGVAAVTGTAAAGAAVISALGGRRMVAEIEEKDNRIILVARNSEQAYAYWEVTEAQKAALRRQGGENLKLRIYDATEIDLDMQPPHSVQEYFCSEIDQDKHVPIPVRDRDYVADLGYTTNDGRWLSLARSLHTHIPGDRSSENPLGDILATGGTAVAGAVASDRQAGESTLDTSSNSIENLFNTGEPNVSQGIETAQQEGENLRNSTANSLGDMLSSGRETVSGAVDNVRQAGESTLDTSSNFIEELFSFGDEEVNTVRPVAEPVYDDSSTNIIDDLWKSGGTATAGGAAMATGAAEARSFVPGEGETQNHIILVAQNPQEAYVYWQVSEEQKIALRRLGGEKLVLRIYDTTDSNLDGQPDNIWQYDCQEMDKDKQIPIHVSDRDYVAELGYLTQEGRWLSLIKSVPTRVSSAE